MTARVTMHPLAARHRVDDPRPLRIAFAVVIDGDMGSSPEHLGVATLIAVLRAAGAECRVFEAGRAEAEAVAARLAGWSPDVVGISLTTLGATTAARHGAAIRRSTGSAPTIVAGGPLATYLGADLLRAPAFAFLDAAIVGEGEIPMLRLAEARRTGQPFDRVRGLCVRRPDGEIVANGTAEVVPDLDDLPSPARDQFLLHGGRLGDDFSCLRVSTSRGCTSACTFCNAPHAGNRMGPVKVWRGMSAERVVDEVALLRRRFHCDSIEFVDSTFEDPGGGARAKQRVYEIAAGLLRRGLDVSWRCTMQACHWSEADLPLLHTLRESGLARVLVGIESGSDAGLRLWGKRSTVADNLRIVDLLARCHIGLDCGFIALHPYVSFDEMRANVAFLRHTGGHLLRRFGSRLELYPAAAVVRRLRADGLLLDHFDSTWDCMAYRFADERVEQLASALESLAPLDTASAALEVAEWAAWQRLSRARRRSDTSTQLVEAAEARHAAVLRRLAQQHADVFLDWIESAEMSRVDVAAIERQTASAVQAMRDAAQKLATLPADLEPSIHPALAAVGA